MVNSENANHAGAGPSNVPRSSDGANVAEILEIVLQAIADVLRFSAPQAQGVPVPSEVPRCKERKDQVQHGGLDRYREEYGRVLKTIDSTGPDSLVREGEPGRMTHWFSHFEGLFRIMDCTEVEKVHLAYIQLKEEDKKWWESTGLADSPVLTWSLFKTLMEKRFSFLSIEKEKHEEFLCPRGEGLEATLVESAGKHDNQRQVQNQPQAGGVKRPMPLSDFAKTSRARADKAPRKCTQHSGKGNDPINCHNCGAPGHKNFNCRYEKRLCFGCKGKGHMQHFCPQRKQKRTKSLKGPVEQSNRPIFSPVEAPNPSMPFTAQYEGRVPVAYWDLGQRLYTAHENGPYAPDV